MGHPQTRYGLFSAGVWTETTRPALGQGPAQISSAQWSAWACPSLRCPPGRKGSQWHSRGAGFRTGGGEGFRACGIQTRGPAEEEHPELQTGEAGLGSEGGLCGCAPALNVNQ